MIFVTLIMARMFFSRRAGFTTAESLSDSFVDGKMLLIRAAMYLSIQKTSDLQVDGLEQQKTTSGSTPVSKEQESKAIKYKDLL